MKTYRNLPIVLYRASDGEQAVYQDVFDAEKIEDFSLIIGYLWLSRLISMSGSATA